MLELHIKICRSQNLGVVIGPPPANSMEQATTPPSKPGEQHQPLRENKKIGLRSIINLNDFEIAASQLLAPKAFACK